VLVREGALLTDSQQMNKNLLLSNDATVNTKPELEIFADDVKCAHGATVGQLDEAALFYLRARGLDDSSAKQLLTRAVAADVLGMMECSAANEYLSATIDERLNTLIRTGGNE